MNGTKGGVGDEWIGVVAGMRCWKGDGCAERRRDGKKRMVGGEKDGKKWRGKKMRKEEVGPARY